MRISGGCPGGVRCKERHRIQVHRGEEAAVEEALEVAVCFGLTALPSRAGLVRAFALAGPERG